MEKTFKLLDFNVYNKKGGSSGGNASGGSSDDDISAEKPYTDSAEFLIQMFGVNEQGKSCSILVEDFKPFFYVKVDDNWTMTHKTGFQEYIKEKMRGPGGSKFYDNSICECKLIKRKKLYGFDGGKEHKFVLLRFNNLSAFNKAKNLWYMPYAYNSNSQSSPKLLKNGFVYMDSPTYIYESNIPPLLRFFHIKEISPSGWIALPNNKLSEIKKENRTTTCDYEYIINYKHIIPLNEKETRVPYKICSFDIEASSSHGDFPVPIKSYKKLSTNIIEYFENITFPTDTVKCTQLLKKTILAAFGYDTMVEIDLVYPKKIPKTREDVERIIDIAMSKTIDSMTLPQKYKNILDSEEDDDENDGANDVNISRYYSNSNTYSQPSKVTKKLADVLCNSKLSRDTKLESLNLFFVHERTPFPELEGDKVTFIGSTFLRFGDQDPYMNHCIILNTCSKIATANTQQESYNTEKEVLLAWRNLIQRENPDIIIGYNIFGFDYEFMFRRAEETNCVEEFLKLSKNKDEICGTHDAATNTYRIEESSIKIASGTHDLRFIKINGRLQVDMYNFFRREENLTSYKLDYVAGHFIGDYVKAIDNNSPVYTIHTTNMTGLQEGSYIHFEEIGHTTDYYQDGAKFQVETVDRVLNLFTIHSPDSVCPDFKKKVRWCLAKDDVTPKDIFRMTNGSADDRAVIAKYCLQDCNLVHYLMNKVDVITGFIEMAKICSVPINFLVMRGQGIKLTSYIAKKCRDRRTLIPVMDKSNMDDGYEGATVLDPKCDLYLDNPVACVDYASLYPSSMISENLSHDSKVWTKEYDLTGKLLAETGEKNAAAGEFIYDNLPTYQYVDVEYDTYKWERKNNNPKATAEKVKCGKKVCRWAQFPTGKAIMPSILEELLVARKTTRKQIPLQTDDFMKNVLDKRQLAYKLTANSLYGQCGAKTSTFYEKDVAASTTATGRLLLTYAKRVIEETYGNAVCNTENYGPVLTKAEYIYGDSVASYTPVYVRSTTNYTMEQLTIEELAAKYGLNKWSTCLELGKQRKEVCELTGIETWTEQGWTPLYRVIRHVLAPHKKMLRIVTDTGLVDVTDDHSLVTKDGTMISPNNVVVGATQLLHHNCSEYKESNANLVHISTFVNQIDAAIYYQLVSSVRSNVLVDYVNDQYQVRINQEPDATTIPNVVKKIIPLTYTGYVYDLTTQNHHFGAGIGNMIVHNTDSVFFTFNLMTPEQEPIRGKKALEITIELAQQAGHLASSFLKQPHDLEYEKTFMPFCLLSKKRYVGMLYETDPNKCKRKEMGIVLKRRDNAPIVKDVYGGIIDILMKEQNIQKAIDFLKGCLQNIVDEKYPMDKLIITKSLRSGYKNPQQIAHKVLADRMTQRDAGNKPGSGDRIPFVYIHNSNKKALQGEKIETPTYILENKLKIDYSFYITNQIMKPVQQLFALVLDKIWIMQNKKPKIAKFKKELEKLKETVEPEKLEEKMDNLKNKEIKILLFDEYIRETNNEKQGLRSMTSFFTPK